MSIHQQGNALVCLAEFLASGVAATGLTVSVDVYKLPLASGTPTAIVTGGSATEIARGAYYYRLAAASVDATALYVFLFYTSGTADQKVIMQGWTVGVTWVTSIDATVSSRLASSVAASTVWDAPRATYAASGTMGEAVGMVPGIKSRTDLITTSGVTTAVPYDTSTGKLILVRGDDYPATITNRVLKFIRSDWPDLTGATVTMSWRLRSATKPTDDPILFSINDTTSLRVAGTSEQSVTFEPTGSGTANGQTGGTDDLVPGFGTGKWDIEATLAGGARVTLLAGIGNGANGRGGGSGRSSLPRCVLLLIQ